MAEGHRAWEDRMKVELKAALVVACIRFAWLGFNPAIRSEEA